jgi:hypothetical protein
VFSGLQTKEAITNLEKLFLDMHQTTEQALEKVADDFYEKLASGMEAENTPAQQKNLECSGPNQQLEKKRRQRELHTDEGASSLDAKVSR